MLSFRHALGANKVTTLCVHIWITGPEPKRLQQFQNFFLTLSCAAAWPRVGGVKTTAYVCVHGVGIHDSGALVADVQEAVRRGVAGLGGHLVERPARTEAGRSDDDDLAGGEMNDDGDLADVEREGLDLAGRELTGRAEVQVPVEDPFIAEFYDGWWDRGAPRPSFWQVLRWALRIAPLLLLNTAWLWFTDRFSETATKSLYGFAAAVLPAALFLALAPAAIVALPVLLLVAAAIPPFRRTVHTVIVDVIGVPGSTGLGSWTRMCCPGWCA